MGRGQRRRRVAPGQGLMNRGTLGAHVVPRGAQNDNSQTLPSERLPVWRHPFQAPMADHSGA